MAKWPVCVCAARMLWETRLAPPADWTRTSTPVLGAEPRGPAEGQATAASEAADPVPGAVEGPAPEGAGDPAAGHVERLALGHARTGLSWWLSAVVIAADQIAKGVVHATLAPFDSVTIIPGLLDFIHVQNSGVAFGILNDAAMNHQLKSILTTALAALALIGIGFYARHVHRHEKLARIGLALILGGAIGNLIDRLRVGYVLDYVDVYWRGWHFWAFNIADASITIGAALVFADLLLVTRHASHPV
jgi:signal peptidase II